MIPRRRYEGFSSHGQKLGEGVSEARALARACLPSLTVGLPTHTFRMVRIKICGIANLDDARAAIAAGADMLGFNFYRPSPRFIEPQAARRMIESLRAEIKALPRTVTMVGVFVNEPAESIVRIAEETGVAAIQLHGDESVEFCRELKALLPDRFLIKALRARAEGVIELAAEYNVDAIMLDAFDAELRGGTGRTVDWHLARHTRDAVPRLFLAGGLSPENVREAIDAVQPYAVDACSALESLPGRKDAERVIAFVRAVRNE
jgi:phosphoribosylanthranilate isomerase